MLPVVRVGMRGAVVKDYDMVELILNELMEFDEFNMVQYEPFAKGWGAWVCKENHCKVNFNPVSSDEDCMEVWDKFVKKRLEIMSNDDVAGVINEMTGVMINETDEKRRRGLLRIVAGRIQ